METDVQSPILALAGKPPASDRGRSREAAIVEAATRHFLDFGYGATTLDAIAKQAGGSKSSLYRFFPTKGDLFQAVVASVVADTGGVRLDPDAEVYGSLFDFAFERLCVVFAPQHWSLLRLIMAERDRFPRIANAYVQIGPRRSRERLAAYLHALDERGSLRAEAPREAADFFVGMLMHEWYVKHLYSAQRLPTKAQKRRRARRVVRSFLASCSFESPPQGWGTRPLVACS